ncbi:site-specific recombinase, phage integrase family [gut metagenome]|uniref:Site-specific recombinase, phage integrase family n=1 Tax=gut metagenome TaxID=749906 RepID=J9H622_9ZZZZ
MANDKERIYERIKENLYGMVDRKAIPVILDIISMSMQGYRVERDTTEVVLYEYGIEKTIYKFVVSKAVEGLSEGSLETYKRILVTFFQSVQKDIKQVTTDDIRIYLACKKMQKKSGNYMNLIRRTLSSFFKWCCDNEILTNNPVRKINSIRVEKKVRKAFSEDEMELLRISAKTLRDKSVIEFLYSTGCRVSEMCSLNISDIDFGQAKATVLGKGKKYRDVYLSPRCKIMLSEYIGSRTDNLEALFVSKPIFAENEKLNRFTKSGVEAMLRSLGKKCGIDNVHPHRFRRTAATLALKRGMPIEQVQKMLGHESIATTTIYAQSNMDDVQASHNKFII